MTNMRLALCHWATDAAYRTLPERQIVATLALAGWTYEARAGHADAELRAAEVLQLLVEQGLPAADGPQGRSFDPVEVLNFIKWQGLAERNDFWQKRCIPTGRRMVDDMAQASGTGPVAVDLRYTRTFGPGAYPQGRVTRFRLPLPVPHPSIQKLRIVDVQTGGLPWQIAADGCRLDVRGDPDVTAALMLSQRLHFTLTPNLPDENPEGTADGYMAPAEGLIQVTDRVRALASDLTRPGDTPDQKVAAFWAFFLDHLCLGAVHYDEFSAAAPATDRTLATGWFDCQTGSALMVALCRASGIPARLVGGLLLYPAAPTPHYWSEIWFDGVGWRPFDLACWDLSAGGRDLGWRQHFAGQTDARLVTERFPLHFTGPSGAHLPAAWHVSNAMIPQGASTTVSAVATGAAVYSNDVSVALGKGVIMDAPSDL